MLKFILIMILLFSPRNFASSLITASSDMEIHGTKFQVTLHIAYVHAFVNPVLFLSLHRGLRQGLSEFFCGCCESIAGWIDPGSQHPRRKRPTPAIRGADWNSTLTAGTANVAAQHMSGPHGRSPSEAAASADRQTLTGIGNISAQPFTNPPACVAERAPLARTFALRAARLLHAEQSNAYRRLNFVNVDGEASLRSEKPW